MLTIDPALIDSNPFVVYHLLDGGGNLQFIGVCKFSQLLSTPDARKSPVFKKIFPNQSRMTIHIDKFFEKKSDATNYYWEWFKETVDKPLMMTHKVRSLRPTKVRCVDTGEIFQNATQAAMDAGVSQPYMSRHLARDPSVVRVGGRIYEWAVLDEINLEGV